jgi:transcriptional regulator with XRE-family HTH domain
MTGRLSKVSRLNDVAARAGVSTATVSRVLNGLGPTSEDVRGRVFLAAKELDYHPNWLAKSLRARRTNTIGPVLPDIENPYGGRAGSGGDGMKRPWKCWATWWRPAHRPLRTPCCPPGWGLRASCGCGNGQG